MTARAEKVAKRNFIIQTGLTRRLVQADDVDEAVTIFKYDTPTRSVLLMSIAEDLAVHEATDEEVAEFQRGRRRKPSDDQLEIELGDPRLTPAQKRASKKEHA